MTIRRKDSLPPELADYLAKIQDELVAGSVSAHDIEPCEPVDASDLAQLHELLSVLEQLRPLMANEDSHERSSEATPQSGMTAESLRAELLPLLTDASPSEAGTSASASEGSELAESPAGQLGRIGRFVIEQRLGSGGQGMVFKALDPKLNRAVALKLPRPEILISPNLRQRFLDEARFAARLSHPHLARVYEVGEIGPVCYIASEYCEGANLAEWLTAQGKLPAFRQSAEVVRQLADAVHAMHLCQVLHRDLKPSNVLLQPAAADADLPAAQCELADLVPKVTDFGLARLMEPTDDRTRTGAVVGTPAYMSPEQALGDRTRIGPATDVYSLGAILFELLSGRVPYGGASDAEILVKIVRGELPDLGRLRKDIPADLIAICSRCLERDVAQRYSSAGELAADLKRFLNNEPTRARPLSAAQRSLRWARRRPAAAALVAVSAVALIVLLSGSAIYTRRLNQALETASANAELADANARQAAAEKEQANERLYSAQIKLADLALEQNRHSDAEHLLEAHGAGTSTAHLRGVEWYMLRDEVEQVANRGSQNTTYHLPNGEALDCCGFTTDGKWLLTGGQSGELSIWDVAKRELVYRWAAHQSCINRLALSADGRYLATASCDRTVKLWRIQGNNEPQLDQTYTDHQSDVYGVAFSSDSQQLASGDAGGHLLVRNLESNEVADRVCDASLEQLCWSPDGRFIVIARSWGRPNCGLTMLFDTETSTFASLGLPGKSIACHPQNNAVAVLEADTVSLINLSAGAGKSIALNPVTEADRIAWSSSGNLFVTAARGHLIVRDMSRGLNPISIDTRVGPCQEVVFSPDEKWVATVGHYVPITLTEIQPKLASWYPFEQQLSPGGNGTLTTVGDTNIVLVALEKEVLEIDPTDGGSTRRIALPADCTEIEISTLGKTIGAICPDRIQLIDVTSGASRELPAEFLKDFLHLTISDEASRIVVFGTTTRVLDYQSLRVLQEVAGEMHERHAYFAYLISPNGRYLARPKSPDYELIDLKTLERRAFHGTPVRFSGDSQRVYVSQSNAFQVFDCQSLNTASTVLFDRTHSYTCQVSPDGRVLAASDYMLLRLFDIATGQELLSHPHFYVARQTLKFSTDQVRLRLIGLTTDGKLCIYDWGETNTGP